MVQYWFLSTLFLPHEEAIKQPNYPTLPVFYVLILMMSSLADLPLVLDVLGDDRDDLSLGETELVVVDRLVGVHHQALLLH